MTPIDDNVATPLSALQIRFREWKSIIKARTANKRPVNPENCPEWDRKLTGLALSGGGIRGATFHLGILQALAERQYLANFDYISAVSGGSFIAGWICKLIHTRAAKHPDGDAMKVVSRKLSPRSGKEAAEVHWLRQHLTYLTPQGGPLAQSTWLFGATYFHNLVINFCVLSVTLGALLIAPRVALGSLYYIIGGGTAGNAARAAGVIAPAIVLGNVLLVIVALINHRLQAIKSEKTLTLPIFSIVASSVVIGVFYYQVASLHLLPVPQSSALLSLLYTIAVLAFWSIANTGRRAKRRFVAVTALAGGFLMFAWFFASANTFAFTPSQTPYAWSQELWEVQTTQFGNALQSWGIGHRTAMAIGTTTVATTFVIVLVIACFVLSTRQLNKLAWLENTRLFDLLKFAVAGGCVILLNTAGIHVLCVIVIMLRSPLPPPADLFIPTMVFVVPVFAASIGLAFSLLSALLGRIISHYVRLHITDICTILYRYAFTWMFVSAVAIYGPTLLYRGKTTYFAFWGIWAVATILSFATRRDLRIRFEPIRHAVATTLNVVPYIFLLCYLFLVAFIISAYVYGIVEWQNNDKYLNDTLDTFHIGSFVLMSLMAVGAFLLSARFGVNSPSMHMFYQSRVADAYLREELPGAELTTTARSEPSEEGGLTSSALAFHELTPEATRGYNGPYLLVNATLNLVSGDEPAWQDRRAANFLLSPLFCGYEPARVHRSRRKYSRNAYLPTYEYRYGNERGIRLAQAMSISGSAIGSSMGYHTSPRVRFLHTILNLRLGWWLANPRFPESWHGRTMRSRIGLLVSELTGKTHDHGPVVHLSDGGHFDNLGLYELIRRRCRVIVVSDASEDHSGYGRALGNAIERCRTDFGIDIEIDASALRAGPDGCSATNVVTGRIHYSAGRKGVLFCVRPVLTGQEPPDILSYAFLHSRFPNESTANQWFKESQFESYRCLGLHIGRILSTQFEVLGGIDRIAHDVMRK